MIALLLLAASQTKLPATLAELPQRYSNGFVRIADASFRIGSLSVATGLYAGANAATEPSAASYAVPRGARYFRGVIGLRPEIKRNARSRFRLLMDGKPVYERLLKPSDGAKRIAVTLNGARVVTFQLDAAVALGDGVFTLEPGVPEANPGAKPVLLTPENGSHVAEDKIPLSWKPVPGATGYAVEIVVTRLESPDASLQKAYLYNVVGATSFVLDLSRMPPGSLRWSVLAFNDEGRVGKFSEDRLLVRD